MTDIPPDLLAEIARYAATLIEQRAKARAKEEFNRAKQVQGIRRDKGPDQKRSTRRQQAKMLILEGLTDGEVEDRTGFCPAMIQRLRSSMGIYKQRGLTQEVLFAIAFELTNTNKTYHQVGRDYGVSRHAVQNIAGKMKEAGFVVQHRKRGRPKGEF